MGLNEVILEVCTRVALSNFCSPCFNLDRAESVQKPADMAKMKQLAKKVTDLQAEKTEIKKNAQLIEAKIKDLQNKILDAGGVKLRAQKSKAEGIREQIEALGDKVTKTKVANNKAEKDIAKLGNQIAKHEKELAEVSEELERLEQEIKEKTQEAVGIRKRAEEAKQVSISYSTTVSMGTKSFTLHFLRRNSSWRRRRKKWKR